MTWTRCCVGNATFTIFNDYKVTRTEYLGTITEKLSSETGLPLEYTRRSFNTPAEAFSFIETMGN